MTKPPSGTSARRRRATRAEESGPAVLDGFDHIKRFYDPRVGRVTAKILPGEFYVSQLDEFITTLLGSCVAVCVWDPAGGVGGMNHFTIPGLDRWRDQIDDPSPAPDDGAARFGIFAMDYLISTILANGGDRRRLQAKVVGGGHVVTSSLAIGRRNVSFARAYAASESLEVVGEHVEGVYPRKVIFHPLTGWARVLELSVKPEVVARLEREYIRSVEQTGISSDVEVF